MDTDAFYVTARQLATLGRENIPGELISSAHLIYSSPATLAFNSPGAQGFGVKRAGLAIPGSVMILIGPGCCGRNTTILSEMGGYSDRFFFYVMDETDIVTGRHLTKIPQAVQKICETLEKKPTVVMLCMTCVDALLGTDMERVCRKAAKVAAVPVVPCYMYALTREGRKPPMVAVRQAVYSLLEPAEKRPDMANLLGYFAPLFPSCELYDLLKQVGIKTINEISRCKSFEEYQTMAQANFNLVLNPESRLAAQDFEERLRIPSIELTRLYQLDKIQNQYRILASVLQVTFADKPYYEKSCEKLESLKAKYPDLAFSIGEGMNGNAFELALAWCRYGFTVKEIFAEVSAADFIYIKQLAQISPDTRIYSNLSPSMLYHDSHSAEVDVAIGKDACYYHPEAAAVFWNDERQPFGYDGLSQLIDAIGTALEKGVE